MKPDRHIVKENFDSVIYATLPGFCGQNPYMLSFEKMTLGDLCLKAAEKYKNRRAFEIYRGGKVYDPVSYRLMGQRARQFGALLQSLGVRAGDRVMILSENSPEWPIALFGAALAGAIAVPVLPDFTPEQIRAIAVHAGVSAICVTERTAIKIAAPDLGVPRLYLDSIENSSAETGIQVSIKGIKKRLPLHEPGKGFSFPQVNEEGPALIIYTSGASGKSKGVLLSHRNLIFCAQASRALMKVFPRDRLLSVIPLAHAYECTLGLLAAIMNGAAITYLDKPPSPVVLLPAIQALRPTIMLTVPLFIEKIYRQKIAPALHGSFLYRCVLTRPLALYLAGRKLNAAFGGSIRSFGIGGAPLSADVEEFLRKIKFPYSPGYGLTEAAPLLTGTAPYHFPVHSAGSSPPGVELRIAPPAPGFTEGEIQARGPNIMMGYYQDEEATKNAFSPDGWLRTGDLGNLDKKGHLYIRGRIKAMILGPSGENIYPEEIEILLNASPLIEESLARAGERGIPTALAVLSGEGKKRREAAPENFNKELEDLKNAVNHQLPPFSRISRIEIRDEPFEKTPTQKIKRFLYS
ncbi:AMP-binding protein [Spirochaetia bacterium]|nr:AMP-binding protein [Spirochaetia bacterium]